MLRRSSIAAVMLALLLAACGGDDNGDPSSPNPTYEDISGTYAGVMSGTSEGVALNGTFSLTINQSSGSLSGSWSLSGTLNDGVQTATVNGTGPFSGNIQSGQNPSVNLTVSSPICPGYQSTFSGSVSSANGTVTLNGPVHILDNSCNVALTYPSVIVLTR